MQAAWPSAGHILLLNMDHLEAIRWAVAEMKHLQERLRLACVCVLSSLECTGLQRCTGG